MSTNISALFDKGLNHSYLLEMQALPTMYDRVFHVEDMEGRYEYEQLWELPGSPVETLPFQETYQDGLKENFSKAWYPVTYTLGDMTSFEDWDDDPTGVLHKVIPGKGGAMARSYNALWERLCADYLATTGFTTTSPAPGSPDGDPLFSTSHPVSMSQSGTTVSNRPSTEVDLSHSSYNAAYANLVQQYSPNYFEITANSPSALIVNPTQRAVAAQIIKGQYERGATGGGTTVGFHDMNAALADDLDLILWPYFRLTGATSAANTWNGWVLLGKTHHLKVKVRQQTRYESDRDINVRAYLHTSYARRDLGHLDWRGTYASTGA